MNNKYKRILLIGFRCAGKSSTAKQLSKLLNMPMVDMDIAIEQEQQKPITEIVDNGKHWERFRQLELYKIQQLLQQENIIISAGGGLGVNNIIFTGDIDKIKNEFKIDNLKNIENLTYGDIQRQLILNSKDTLKILLFADEAIIRQRLYEDKIKGKSRTDLNKISVNIEEYVENNITVMKEREQYYDQMADIKFDTSVGDILKSAKKLEMLIANLN